MCDGVVIGADFNGIILEGPFNNIIEAASNYPLTAVCYSLSLMHCDVFRNDCII